MVVPVLGKPMWMTTFDIEVIFNLARVAEVEEVVQELDYARLEPGEFGGAFLERKADMMLISVAVDLKVDRFDRRGIEVHRC